VKIRVRGQRVILSLGTGLALAFAFPDYNLPVLGWVSLAGLIVACLGAGIAEAALCGLLYGAAFYTFSLPWIYTVLRQYGLLPVWQAAGVNALVVIILSLFCAAFAVAVAWVARRSAGLAIAAAPFLWVASELARTHMPDIGFPWNLLGYTASGSLALLQIAPFTGIYGLSFLVAAYNAALVWFLRSLFQKPRGRAAARLAPICFATFTAVLLIVVAVGARFVPVAPSDHVAHLVQTDLEQSMDYPANWDALHAGDMAEIDRITIIAANHQPGLVAWPEAPAPFSLQQPSFALRAAGIARLSESHFLVGVIDWEPAPNDSQAAYNGAAMVDTQGRREFLYDKMRLVPFSEYVPWRNFFWFARDLTGLVGDFQHGTSYAVGSLPGGRFSVFICYEAVFPDEVRRFALAGAGLLINLSNDGWFGRSAAPAQHLAMARVRAVENRRWLLRDTNNGLTASVDPYGRIVATLPPDTRGELDAPYGFRTDLTVYTRWGDWLAYLSAMCSGLVLVWASMLGKSAPVAGASRGKGFRDKVSRKRGSNR
jgi:apolipoprotein N-acyltransferase